MRRTTIDSLLWPYLLSGFMLLGGARGASAQSRSASDPQDRPFMFSVSTVPTDRPHVTVHVDSGFGDRAFGATDSDHPEQRFGIQASLTNRLAFIARVGISSNQQDSRSSQHGELLYNVLQSPRTQGSVALGLGLRHESEGVNVLMGRLAAGRSFSAWRLDGNALFEKPFSTARDTVDLITTIGVSRRLLPAVYAGAEVIGEDLEGFWEADEAEGGARLLVGPSVRIAPVSQPWQVSIAGGPVFHATRASGSSQALRGLPPSSSGGTTYAVRASLSYGF